MGKTQQAHYRKKGRPSSVIYKGQHPRQVRRLPPPEKRGWPDLEATEVRIGYVEWTRIKVKQRGQSVQKGRGGKILYPLLLWAENLFLTNPQARRSL